MFYMYFSILFRLKGKGILVINLTIKEKNDLDEVYNCLSADSKFNFALNSFYKVGELIIKKWKRNLSVIIRPLF